MWSTGFYQRLSILFYKVIVSKIEFIITRGVPEGSPWFCLPHRYFAFSGDEAVSGITVRAHYTTFHVLLDSSILSLRCPFWGYDLMTGGWVLPYWSYIVMCCPTGFLRHFAVWKRVYTLPILLWNRVWFSRELRDCMNVFIVSIPNE